MIWRSVYFMLTMLVMIGSTDSVVDEFIYLVLGKTGVGKSSFVNMMNMGHEIAIEGITYDSETMNTTLYDTSYANIKLVDTPGLYDTRGYTNEEIYTLIRSTMISESLYSISGVLLMFDPLEIKIHFKSVVEAMLFMFKPSALQHMFVIFNKNKRLDEEKKTHLVSGTVDILEPIFMNHNIDFNVAEFKKRILFLDTKMDMESTSNQMNKLMMNMNGKINVVTDEEIRSQIDAYFEKEVKDENNYKTIVDEIPHSKKKTRMVPTEVIEHYTENCNPHKSCKKVRFIFRVSWDCHTVWDTCARTRTVIQNTEDEYWDHWTEKRERKVLKYTEEYLWEKAKEKMVGGMRTKIYDSLQKRNQNKKEL